VSRLANCEYAFNVYFLPYSGLTPFHFRFILLATGSSGPSQPNKAFIDQFYTVI